MTGHQRRPTGPQARSRARTFSARIAYHTWFEADLERSVASVLLARFIPLLLEHLFVYPTGHARSGRPRPPPCPAPIAAPLEHCAELLDVDPAAILEAAADVEPYVRVDGTKVWSLMQLERQLRPDAYGRVRGGYITRRRPRTIGTLGR